MSDNDQYAVEALCKIKHEIRGRSVQGTWSKEWGIGEDGARAILDAIREGEVPIPGMVTEAVWRAAEAEVERLREFERSMTDLWKTVMDEKCGTDEVHCSCVPALRHLVNTEKARADKAEAELAKLSGLSEFITYWKARADKAFQCHDDAPCGACITCLSGMMEDYQTRLGQVNAQRDRLMLEVAELRQAQHVIDSSAVNMAAHQAEQQRDRLAGLLRRASPVIMLYAETLRPGDAEKSTYQIINDIDAALAEV